MRILPSIEFVVLCECGLKIGYSHEDYIQAQGRTIICPRCQRQNALNEAYLLDLKIIPIQTQQGLLQDLREDI